MTEPAPAASPNPHRHPWDDVLHWHATPFLIGALALTAIATGSNVLPGDVTIARAVQAVPLPGAPEIARAGYWIGATSVTIGLAALLTAAFVFVGRFAEALLLLGTIVARGLNPMLKAMVDSPRPTAAWVRITEYPSGLGFPSSHAMGVVILFGAVGFLAHRHLERRVIRLAVEAGCALAILVTGFGRIYTGAHWPSDVLGGYFYGAALLVLIIAATRALSRRLHRALDMPSRSGASPVG